MSRDSVTEYLTTLVWAAIDGFARQRDVVIDPNVPLEINRVIQLSHGHTAGAQSRAPETDPTGTDAEPGSGR